MTTSTDAGHDWQQYTHRGMPAKQRRCTRCDLYETPTSRAHPCGEPWPDDPRSDVTRGDTP